MSGKFFDTNVLLYLGTSTETEKADKAEELLRQGGIVSVQVLNEIANVARRKMGLSWPQTRSFLSLIRELLPVRPITIEIHDAGTSLAERYRLSIYDAMVAASALDADCDTLWSEDMQDGMVLDGKLRIINPFRRPS
jgi:predicted nucleic acid-binding protein